MSSWQTQWSEEQIQIVSGMFRAGASRDEIAAAVGRKKEAVARQLTKLGLTRNDLYWTPERNAKLRELWRTTMPLPEICAELGEDIGEDAVKAQAGRIGLPRRSPAYRSPPWNDEHDARLNALREQGLTFKEVAAQLGRSVNSCRVRWHDLNPPEPAEVRLAPSEEIEQVTRSPNKHLAKTWLRAMVNVARGAV